MNVKVVHKECEKILASDSSLPVNSFLVHYIVDGESKYDIVISDRISTVFDMYWDNHREDLKAISWTAGKVSPKLWGIPKPESKKGR